MTDYERWLRTLDPGMGPTAMRAAHKAGQWGDRRITDKLMLDLYRQVRPIIGTWRCLGGKWHVQAPTVCDPGDRINVINSAGQKTWVKLVQEVRPGLFTFKRVKRDDKRSSSREEHTI